MVEHWPFKPLVVGSTPTAPTNLLYLNQVMAVRVGMNQSTVTVLVIAFLSLLAVFATVASVLILSGGKVYHKIPEKSRPRRWVVAIFFSYFVLFCLWFPVWLFYQRSMLSHVLGFLFAAFTAFIGAWFVMGKVGRILSPIIALVLRIRDAYSDRSEAKRR